MRVAARCYRNQEDKEKKRHEDFILPLYQILSKHHAIVFHYQSLVMMIYVSFEIYGEHQLVSFADQSEKNFSILNLYFVLVTIVRLSKLPIFSSSNVWWIKCGWGKS